VHVNCQKKYVTERTEMNISALKSLQHYCSVSGFLSRKLSRKTLRSSQQLVGSYTTTNRSFQLSSVEITSNRQNHASQYSWFKSACLGDNNSMHRHVSMVVSVTTDFCKSAIYQRNATKLNMECPSTM